MFSASILFYFAPFVCGRAMPADINSKSFSVLLQLIVTEPCNKHQVYLGIAPCFSLEAKLTGSISKP